MRKYSSLLILALLSLLAVPAVADDTVYSGSDLWFTPGDGSTFAGFSRDPIPKGFFCHKSEPFTGRIAFKGVPVSNGDLGITDTIIYRLDDGVFNNKGVATTRIQVRALSFESINPIQTACGRFNVRVSLNGDQPITRMKIVRENENGGRFFSPIAVNVRMTFTPVDGKATERLEVTRNLRFPAARNAFWSYRESLGQKAGFALVDTDGDRRPDTYVPGVSNFGAGLVRRGKAADLQSTTINHLIYEHAHYTSSTEQLQ